MFKVEVGSVEDYLAFDPGRRGELEGFDAAMAGSAPGLERHFHAGTPVREPGMRFKMIGYGRFQYPSPKGTLVAWPVVGVALQKNYISVYLSVTKDGAPLLAGYAARLGALRAGRNNFSFERFADLNGPTLEALIADAARIVRAEPENPVRCRLGPPPEGEGARPQCGGGGAGPAAPVS